MTFTTSIKEEIAKQDINVIESRYELIAFMNSVANINKEIIISLENASVARKIYKEIKEIFGVSPKITIRIQRRFKVKQIYILEIKDRIDYIKKSLEVKKKVNIDLLDSDEEKIAYIKGAFLAVGNISNPSTSGYHLEFIFSKELQAKQILKLLKTISILKLN